MKTNSYFKYFIIANALWLAAVIGFTMPGRIFTLQMQGATLDMYERQLAILEENYLMYEENAAFLAYLQGGGSGDTAVKYIIQPAGHVGALLTEIRRMLHNAGLQNQEFSAMVQGFHYVDQMPVTEIRASLSAEGDKGDIITFIHKLADHYRLLQIDWIQISKESTPPRLWINFTIYEEA